MEAEKETPASSSADIARMTPATISPPRRRRVLIRLDVFLTNKVCTRAATRSQFLLYDRPFLSNVRICESHFPAGGDINTGTGNVIEPRGMWLFTSKHFCKHARDRYDYGFFPRLVGAGFSASIFRPFLNSSRELFTIGKRLSVGGALTRNSARVLAPS